MNNPETLKRELIELFTEHGGLSFDAGLNQKNSPEHKLLWDRIIKFLEENIK